LSAHLERAHHRVMTNRIAPIDRHTESPSERESLALVEARKIRPNNFLRILGHSPAALGGYFVLNDQIGKVRLGTRLREMISLAVSQYHRCPYCLSAHTYTASHAGVDATTIDAARAAHSANPREQAAIAFALALVEARGHVAASRLTDARAAGLDDVDLIEIAAVVATMTFSNYVNIMADTEIDFPPAPNLPRID
jgi:uncharacterized peroxidase-related enzyme